MAEIEALPAGTELSEVQRETVQDWNAFLDQQFISPELGEQQLRQMRSGYFTNFIGAAPINLIIQTLGFITNGFWDALAMMLLGMAFFRWGLFDGSRSLRTYSLMALIGLGIGLPLNTWETITFVSSGFELQWTAFNRPTYDLGRLSLAVGYIGVVMLVCKLGLARGAQDHR